MFVLSLIVAYRVASSMLRPSSKATSPLNLIEALPVPGSYKITKPAVHTSYLFALNQRSCFIVKTIKLLEYRPRLALEWHHDEPVCKPVHETTPCSTTLQSETSPLSLPPFSADDPEHNHTLQNDIRQLQDELQQLSLTHARRSTSTSGTSTSTSTSAVSEASEPVSDPGTPPTPASDAGSIGEEEAVGPSYEAPTFVQSPGEAPPRVLETKPASSAWFSTGMSEEDELELLVREENEKLAQKLAETTVRDVGTAVETTECQDAGETVLGTEEVSGEEVLPAFGPTPPSVCRWALRFQGHLQRYQEDGRDRGLRRTALTTAAFNHVYPVDRDGEYPVHCTGYELAPSRRRRGSKGLYNDGSMEGWEEWPEDEYIPSGMTTYDSRRHDPGAWCRNYYYYQPTKMSEVEVVSVPCAQAVEEGEEEEDDEEKDEEEDDHEGYDWPIIERRHSFSNDEADTAWVSPLARRSSF